MLAHVRPKDMRIAISYALHGAASVDAGVRPLDLVEVGKLTFEAVDLEAFPCLRLAREAAQAGGTAPCVLNAANEIAVHAFLRDVCHSWGSRRRSSARWMRSAAAGQGLRVALRGRPCGAGCAEEAIAALTG